VNRAFHDMPWILRSYAATASGRELLISMSNLVAQEYQASELVERRQDLARAGFSRDERGPDNLPRRHTLETVDDFYRFEKPAQRWMKRASIALMSDAALTIGELAWRAVNAKTDPFPMPFTSLVEGGLFSVPTGSYVAGKRKRRHADIRKEYRNLTDGTTIDDLEASMEQSDRATRSLLRQCWRYGALTPRMTDAAVDEEFEKIKFNVSIHSARLDRFFEELGDGEFSPSNRAVSIGRDR
jgi:hypothetical protein